MRSLSAIELLDVWERGLNQSLAGRALTLLAAGWPEMEPQALASLSIGERDARLLTLREWTFGSKLASRVVCSSCSESLEVNFETASLRVQSEATRAEPILSLCIAEYH